MSTLIEVDGLRKVFGSLCAVDNLSFSVPRGEVLGFLGPNGAGKSTTMKMLTGFLTPTAGSARICGADIIRQSSKTCTIWEPKRWVLISGFRRHTMTPPD